MKHFAPYMLQMCTYMEKCLQGHANAFTLTSYLLVIVHARGHFILLYTVYIDSFFKYLLFLCTYKNLSINNPSFEISLLLIVPSKGIKTLKNFSFKRQGLISKLFSE